MIPFGLPEKKQTRTNYNLLIMPCQGVNFINVKRMNFLYKCHFGSFFSSYLYVKKAAEMTFVRKIRTYNVDEIDGRAQQ